MKTTFSRIFTLFAALILLCLVVLGTAFQAVLSNYLKDEKQETLANNAQTLATLAAVYDGELDNRWGDFRMGFISVSKVMGAEAMVCGLDGQVRVCSCEEVDCVHWEKSVSPTLVSDTLRDGEVFYLGPVEGIYEKPHFVEAVPLLSQWTQEPTGILVVTAPMAQISGVLDQTITIFFYVSVFVLAVAMAATFLFSRNLAGSIQTVAAAATRFGHGELEVRVPTGGRNTQELDELATAFNAMAESMAQSERQRQEFVANVSHELKTPMTTIAGFMDGMLDGAIPPEQHPHYMRVVSDEVRRLSRLVRSMLDVSRLQSQGISEEKKRRFDLCETIGQVLISFEQRVNRKHILMDVQLPDRSVWTKADPDSITQVIYNLTDNAIKFCNDGGMLSIRLVSEGGKARVTVENTGPTVPPEELPLLFDRFHKTDKSRSEDREGVGLGLYIVKTILDSHGENITVTSADGVTSFTFTLPQVR